MTTVAVTAHKADPYSRILAFLCSFFRKL